MFTTHEQSLDRKRAGNERPAKVAVASCDADPLLPGTGARETAFVTSWDGLRTPNYMAMTAAVLHREYNRTSLIEVSSLAVAEKLAFLLNSGRAQALATEHARRLVVDLLRSAISARNSYRGRIAQSTIVRERAKRVSTDAQNREVRKNALRHALAADRALRELRNSAAWWEKEAREIQRVWLT